MVRFVLRNPEAPGGNLAEAAEHLEAVRRRAPGLWSPSVNLHWLAAFLGRPEAAARIADEAGGRAPESPFEGAYFSRYRLERGDPAAALVWVGKSPPAPDAHVRTELALAAMRAHFLRGDLEALFAAYADRMRASDGDRDRQHVVIHFVHSMQALWEEGRKGFEPADFAEAARRTAAREPAEIGHEWTVWALLTATGRRRETVESMLASYDRFGGNASHREFLVACAWRVLEAAEPAKPN